MAQQAPSLGVQRPQIVQQFRTFSFAVGTAPLPIDPGSDKSKLITTFVISNPTTGASVFLGNSGVTTTTGLEIPAGTAPAFIIQQERQIYEIQSLVRDIASGLQCRSVELEAIPVEVWDMSTMFLVAGAATTVSVMLLPSMYL